MSENLRGILFLTHTVYWAHRAVVLAIGQLSCYNCSHVLNSTELTPSCLAVSYYSYMYYGYALCDACKCT